MKCRQFQEDVKSCHKSTNYQTCEIPAHGVVKVTLMPYVKSQIASLP